MTTFVNGDLNEDIVLPAAALLGGDEGEITDLLRNLWHYLIELRNFSQYMH